MVIYTALAKEVSLVFLLQTLKFFKFIASMAALIDLLIILFGAMRGFKLGFFKDFLVYFIEEMQPSFYFRLHRLIIIISFRV